MQYTGAEIIIKMLEIHGIERIAGIPGGANLPMYHALAASSRIHHVLARHEQGAGFIAQGQARSTGKVGVFFATSGPGATNAITAVADARLDSIPLVCITGQVPRHLIGTDAFQEIDTYGLSVPITKHNYFVRSAAELLTVIPEAFRIAGEGRPGPVWIDVPKDVQNERTEVMKWPEPLPLERAASRDKYALQQIASLVNAAKRPIVYLGGGAVHAGAHQEIGELIERLGAPTTSSLMGLGVVATDHPFFIGMLGMHAARYTNMLLQECDTLIALGVRFDDRATGKVEAFCPQAKIVHIDIDGSEIAKIKQPHASMVADLKDALDQLLPLIAKRNPLAWQERMRELRSLYPLDLGDTTSCFSPYGMLLNCAQALKDPYFITTDVGQHQMRVAQCFPFQQPRQWLTSGGLGTMGFGLPAAIGVALEHPEASVLCITGDGSLLMNIQELALIAEENLNVKVIVCNNDALGLVYQQQNLFYQQRVIASTYQQKADFVGIARAFGVDGCDLSQAEDPINDLRELIRRPGGMLINIPVDLDSHVFPMVPPGGANHEMLHSQNQPERRKVSA